MSKVKEILRKAQEEGGYLTAVDIAILIRERVKVLYPGVKFSIRCHHGTSIKIEWIDGPSKKSVESLADGYQTAGFDGMIDLAYSYDLWIAPDGSSSIAETGGTQGSGGVVPPMKNPKHHPDAVLVKRILPVYVHTDHLYSRAAIERGIYRVAARNYPELAGIDWLFKVEIIPEWNGKGYRLSGTASSIPMDDGGWLGGKIMSETEKAFFEMEKASNNQQ